MVDINLLAVNNLMNATMYAKCSSAPTQQTQNICITFVQCRTKVFDVGPTLYKWYALCLLGCLWTFAMLFWIIMLFTLLTAGKIIVATAQGLSHLKKKLCQHVNVFFQTRSAVLCADTNDSLYRNKTLIRAHSTLTKLKYCCTNHEE